MGNDDSLGSPVPPGSRLPLRGDFVPANAPILTGRIVPDPKWIERLRHRHDTILLLSRGLRTCLTSQSMPQHGVDDICAAIEALLGADVAEQLENMASIQGQPIPPPTLEDMERAQRDVEQAQAVVDALDKMIESLPEASRDFLDAAQRPVLEANLKRAQAWLSEIQRAMEAGTSSPAVQYAGSIGTMCAGCSIPFEGVETSIAALKERLKAAGWGRDADGDHICPACVAAQDKEQSA
jgi:hypothetical protein